jgi:4-hydroxyproline epimerase
VNVRELEVIDSHTEGEPTRVVIGGWPMPAGDTMAARRDFMRSEQDMLRRGTVTEPRGHDAIVGALLTPPVNEGSAVGVVFFNDVGYLGMCGHGLIGVVRTLEHLGRATAGTMNIDTPVGRVSAELGSNGSVTIENVPARVHATGVEIDVRGYGRIRGDVAWGGNWFFLVDHSPVAVEYASLRQLLELTFAIREALAEAAITGEGSAPIDHVELHGPAARADVDARNFVLCPGAAWDRSPCGTGTSAKMASLHARGGLAVGKEWRQESITGGLFSGRLSERDGELIPHITGRAFITARGTLCFDEGDPFRFGFSEGPGAGLS